MAEGAVRFFTAISKDVVTAGGLETFAIEEVLRREQRVLRANLAAALEAELKLPDSELIQALHRNLEQRPDLRKISPQDISGYFQSILTPGGAHTDAVQIADVAPVAAPTLAPLTSGHGLDVLYAKAATLVTNRTPTKVVLPNGVEKNCSTWRDVAAEVLIWVGQQGKSLSLPFRGSRTRGANCFLNTSPHHPDGRPMRPGDTRTISFGNQVLYMDGNRSGSNLVSDLCTLCEQLNISSNMIRVVLRQ